MEVGKGQFDHKEEKSPKGLYLTSLVSLSS